MTKSRSTVNEDIWSARTSRRSLLRGGAAVAATVAVGLPLTSCTIDPRRTPASNPTATTSVPTGGPGRAIANVRIGDHRYGFHVEPSVAANPRNRNQLLVASQVSPS